MINTAVVGYGYAGRCFHTYLITLAQGLRLYAVATRDPRRREAAAKDHRVKTYAHIDDLLADEQVDLVVIATPHDTHAELAIQALEAGKNVVTDKVMCMNASEADAMIAAAERHGVMLSVFQNRRWDWDFATLKQVLADGRIGAPCYFESSVMRYGGTSGWRTDKARSGGIIYDWGAHLVDQMFQLVDAQVDRVYCEIQYRGWGAQIGSYAKLLVHFKNDVLFQIEIGHLAKVPKPRWYVLAEQGGLIQYGLDPQEGPMVRGHIDAAEENPDNRVRLYTDARGADAQQVIDSVKTSWKSYYQNISDVLNKGTALVVTPQESRRVMRLLDAASKSAQAEELIAVTI